MASDWRPIFRVVTLNKPPNLFWLAYHVEHKWTILKYSSCMKIYHINKIERSISKLFQYRLFFGWSHPSYKFWQFKILNTSLYNLNKLKLSLTCHHTPCTTFSNHLHFSRFSVDYLFVPKRLRPNDLLTLKHGI